ncbi:MAG: LPS-assembly protein LptD [Candidatus Ordinivivax streblomastigis]|uniref:LPS-assembly protein LptD n=1 Tax=Candidatus Ordinivivax streblomastigis TaxID=2540710 RepID=A0A5M8P0S4_9BACT|nr:MAG: LPS-assembly protein LptD [Candidatus Ordinivivax streblomastigis]
MLFLLATVASGMQQTHSSPSKGRTSIAMEYADSTVMEESRPGIHVLRGNVRFRHDSVYLFCDSAYYYHDNNSLEAFSNVHIEQGDTLNIYGNYLIYEGNSKLAKMRENVRMENNSLTLFTDFLDYDRNQNLGYFFDGGLLVDSINELTSVYGQYSPATKIATFKDEVILTNPQFVLKSDTLKYDTSYKIATILGPTVIESDSGLIHSTRGWYNTETDRATLYDRSEVLSKDGSKTMTADTLFYNRATGFGEAFSRMVLNDTVRKLILTGHYGYFDDVTDIAFATDSAQFIEYSQKDSLFLHADTLYMKSIGTEREVKAFYGVRFFRTDLQGICDSMFFSTRDSVLHLIKNPVMWNTGYQITGDTINVFFNDSTLERVNVIERAFAIEQKDTTYFNQIKGRNMTAFFTAGELARVDVEGNTESIYYPIEDNGTEFIGRTKVDSPNMIIYVENRKPAKIWWGPEPKMELLPIPDLNPENKFLKDFVNFDYLRPVDRESIFIQSVYKTEDIPAPRRYRSRSTR